LIRSLDDGPIALDTSIFIYFIEAHAGYLPQVAPLFEAAARGERQLVTSSLTLLEVLVVPLRRGHASMAARYEALLTQSRGIHLIEIGRPLLRAAAQLRASLSVRTPDALQLAAAFSSGCTTFITNDRGLPPVPGLKVVQLRQPR
jgi:predicted nucleic acid-binding protein